MEKETRTVPVGLRLKPSLKKALDKAAKADNRTVAGFIEHMLTEHLRAKGYLK